MRDVYINGYSHLSALGDEEAVSARIRDVPRPPAVVTLPIAEVPPLSHYMLSPPGTDRAELACAVLRRAMAHSSLAPQLLRDGHCFVGSSSLGIDHCEAQAERDGCVVLNSVSGLNRASVAVAARAELAGPLLTLNTACTSSVNALLSASWMIRAGHIEHAIVMAFEPYNMTTVAGFYALQLLTEQARPFDVERRGIVLGEAIAVVVLSVTPHPHYRLKILGGANHGDTHSPTGTDALGASLAKVMAEAIQLSRVDVQDITFIKAHGAGSPRYDHTEACALHRIFTSLPPITSVKAYIGHTMGASGLAELSLLLSCYRAGFTPATAGYEHADPTLNLHPLRQAMDSVPRYTLLNFLGFGGNNSALVVEYQGGVAQVR